MGFSIFKDAFTKPIPSWRGSLAEPCLNDPPTKSLSQKIPEHRNVLYHVDRPSQEACTADCSIQMQETLYSDSCSEYHPKIAVDADSHISERFLLSKWHLHLG